MADKSDDKPLVGKIDVQPGGKSVVARNIGAVHIHSDPVLPLTPLDPFATVPPLPTHFMKRPELSEPILETLLSGSEAIALTGVAGMGGVGKTVIALGVCHDPRIRARFQDGIVWLHIGKEMNTSKEKLIERVAEALNQRFRVYSTNAYTSLLSNKSVLVILDNVWSLDSVEPFLISSGRSRLLYTSRDRGLAGPLGADSREVDVLDGRQARLFLARWAKKEPEAIPEPYASEILAECKGLVLALAMVGATLKHQPDQRWRYLRDDLKKAKLRKIGVRPSGYGYENLHASIAVSVNALDTTTKTNYLRLAVLLEDMGAPLSLLQALWEGNEREIDELVCLLVDRSLASRDAAGNIRLHDLQLDYIRGEHSDPTALSLQHSALLRSLHVVRFHPEQFASQMIGRLLAHRAQPGIASFLEELDARAPRPRMRPLHPSLEAAGGPALRVFEGHADEVNAVALSADGKRAVSASDDKTVRVWDMEGMLPPRVLQGHTDRVNAVAVSADGTRIVSASDDETVRVWDMEGIVPPQALSPRGSPAMSASDDNASNPRSSQQRSSPKTLSGHTDSVMAVAMTPDETKAVSGSKDSTLKLWNLGTGEEVRTFYGHKSGVRGVVVTPDGKRAISASYDSLLKVWDLESGKELLNLRGHSSWVYAVAVAPDGKSCVSASRDQTLKVWNLETGQERLTLSGHTGYVRAVAVTSDGKSVISGSSDQTLNIWNLETGGRLQTLTGHTNRVSGLAVARDGKRAASASGDRSLRVWSLGAVADECYSLTHRGGVNAVVVMGNRTQAITASDDRTLKLWDWRTGREGGTLTGHTGEVTSLVLTPDGQHAVSASADHTLRVWDLDVRGGQAGSVARPDGLGMVSTDAVETMELDRTRNSDTPTWAGRKVRTLRGHVDWVNAVAITPDGKQVLSGSDDRTLKVWEFETGSELQTLTGHKRSVTALVVTPDGRHLISASDDCTLKIWELTRGHEIHVLGNHAAGVTCVAITPDGEHVVSASEDGVVKVWNLKTGRELRTLAGHSSCVNTVAVSADGKHVVSGADDHSLRVWRLEDGNGVAAFYADADFLGCATTVVSELIVAGDSSGTVHFLRLENELLP